MIILSGLLMPFFLYILLVCIILINKKFHVSLENINYQDHLYISLQNLVQMVKE